MSRLEVKTPSQAQAVVEQLYRNMEGRIAASPPGLCPVDMALNFLNLCQAQTCGKCVPCRIGLSQISDMIREVLDGRLTSASCAGSKIPPRSSWTARTVPSESTRPIWS